MGSSFNLLKHTSAFIQIGVEIEQAIGVAKFHETTNNLCMMCTSHYIHLSLRWIVFKFAEWG